MTEKITKALLPKPREIKFTGGYIAGDSGALQKIIRLDDPTMPPETYRLAISSAGVTVRSGSESGAFYARMTLQQLLAAGETQVPCLEIRDEPAIAVRGVHICCHKGHRSSFENMLRAVKILAGWKVNLLVLENDDGFPWQRHPAVAGTYAWTLEQIAELRALAAENHVQLAPLLNSFGHAQAFLSRPEYTHLRERPEFTDEMCPSNPETMRFVQDMWLDLFDMFPESKYVMIGGDEVFRKPGFCVRCRAYHESDRLADLYVEYYTKLSQWIIEHGKKPIVWGDMLIKYHETIDKFPRNVIVGDWQYHAEDASVWNTIPNRTRPDGKKAAERRELFGKYWGETEMPAGHCREFPFYNYFKDQGFTVWGVTLSEEEQALKPLPSPSWSVVNNKRFAMKIAANGGAGMINTHWGMAPLEASWPGLAAGADYAWHARNESTDQFMRRFAANFIGNADAGESLLEIERDFTARRQGFLREAWLACLQNDRDNGVQNLCRSFPVQENHPAHVYMLIQQWGMRVARWAGKLGELFNRVDRLMLGEADYRPLALTGFLNASDADCTPSAVRLMPPSGRQQALGVDFILAAERLIALRGSDDNSENSEQARVTGIPVHCKPERLCLLVAGYNVVPGSPALEIIFNFADGTCRSESLTGGDQIPEWTVRPVRGAARNAVLAYIRGTKGLWLSWVDNSENKTVESLDLIATGDQSLVMLYALTAVFNRRSASATADEIENIRMAVNALLFEGQALNEELAGIYRTMGMAAPDIEEGVNSNVIAGYCTAAKVYLEKCEANENTGG